MSRSISYTEAMRAALHLSRRGFPSAAPNPCVGAVLVKGKRIVAYGWHKAYGEAHAEVEALQDAKRRGVNAAECTMVVTLEPCNHQGKTPPCTKAILEAGIKHVVIGAKDPTGAGGGAEFLRAQGVQVDEGVLEQECLDNIADFLCWQNTTLPYVILKLASTLDGRIATRTGHSRWISCPESRQLVHKLRSEVQAVLVGGNTFYMDNPRLDHRLGDFAQSESEGSAKDSNTPQPLAVVISSRLPELNEKSPRLNLLQDRPSETIFWTTAAVAASPKASALRGIGVRVEALPALPPGRDRLGGVRVELNIRQGLETLRAEHGCRYVLCEGGGHLGLALLREHLAQELLLFVSPQVLGDNDAKPLFDGLSPQKMDEALGLRFHSIEPIGTDMLLRLRLKDAAEEGKED